MKLDLKLLLEGDQQEELIQSLHDWLSDDPDIRRGAEMDTVSESAGKGEMAGTFEIISLVVSSAFNLGSLAMSYLAWRSSQGIAPPLQVTIDSETVVVLDGSDGATQQLIAKNEQPE